MTDEELQPKPCPSCGKWMDRERAWWWTGYGAACSEGCARDLIRDHEGGIHRPRGLPMTADVTREPTGGQELREALRIHHPIMRSETGPFSGCRCGQVGLGQDVIAHVVAELRAALDGDQP